MRQFWDEFCAATWLGVNAIVTVSVSPTFNCEGLPASVK